MDCPIERERASFKARIIALKAAMEEERKRGKKTVRKRIKPKPSNLLEEEIKKGHWAELETDQSYEEEEKRLRNKRFYQNHLARKKEKKETEKSSTPTEEKEGDWPSRKRRRQVRARTIAVKRLTKDKLRIGRLLYPDTDYWKPRTRAECKNGPRPCPFVSCKHHLYLDVNPTTGSIKLNFPDLEPHELKESCGLDVADRGGITLEEVGELMNLTRERIRQVELLGLERVRENQAQFSLKEYY